MQWISRFHSEGVDANKLATNTCRRCLCIYVSAGCAMYITVELSAKPRSRRTVGNLRTDPVNPSRLIQPELLHHRLSAARASTRVCGFPQPFSLGCLLLHQSPRCATRSARARLPASDANGRPARVGTCIVCVDVCIYFSNVFTLPFARSSYGRRLEGD